MLATRAVPNLYNSDFTARNVTAQCVCAYA